MDILKPQLLWMGKRCYRLNQGSNDKEHEQQARQTNEYVEDDLYGEDEEMGQDDFPITEVSPNRFTTSLSVPQEFYGAIIGAKGSVKKRIESDTRTGIKIPKHGSSGDIEIVGTKRDSVRSARNRIEAIVINCRRKQRPTHFTCVRLTDSTIKENYIKFKDEILNHGPILGLQEEMFIQPHKLHITIGAMVLMDDSDRSRAVDLLNECCETIAAPIKSESNDMGIRVSGVEIMNDDPSSVKVLYGKIQSDALQQIGDVVLKRFIDSGLAKKEFGRDTCKLHMTLIKANNKNSDDDDDGAQQKPDRRRFDARHILEKYKDYDFGSQQFTEISLAIMGSKDPDGFYKCTTTIQI